MAHASGGMSGASKATWNPLWVALPAGGLNYASTNINSELALSRRGFNYIAHSTNGKLNAMKQGERFLVSHKCGFNVQESQLLQVLG